jgi:L-alanine-DL-glutamate epimerase-like enolase superfamily enzyme
MRIVAIREQTFQISTTSRNASIGFDSMTASAIAVETDATRNGKRLVGLAFDSIGRYGHGGLLRERFIPRLVSAHPNRYVDDDGNVDPHLAWNVLMQNEKPGGHGERCGAVGLIDAALWDLVAKRADEPLWRTLAKRHGIAQGRDAGSDIAVYASGGHYQGSNDIICLSKEINHAMDNGHRHFKIKIGGASSDEDRARIESVLALLERGMSLAVDANGTFDRDKCVQYLELLAPYRIAWIEELAPPLDFELCRDLAAHTKSPLATGENLFSRDDAQNLLRYGGLRADRDVLQFDISLSYGVVEYLRILGDLEERGWSRGNCAPHAGHLFAMHCVAGLGLKLAEVAMDTAGLFGKLTSGVRMNGGVGTLPDAPGVGFECTPVFNELFGSLLN